ncbi:MAG: serine hydrolase, partial [Pseudomonadota bacterium]
AKVICSGVFITGREPEEILTSSCLWMAAPDSMVAGAIETGDPTPLLELPFEIKVDPADQSVALSLFGETGFARRHDDQGCIVAPFKGAPIEFKPRSLPKRPSDDGLWPAEIGPADAGATGCDGQKIIDAADRLFENPMQFTNAFLVIHKGKLIMERYRAPFDVDTQFESWSMGKSIAASLIGVLHREGAVGLDETDLFAEWRDGDDPRRSIAVRNLLNMASGLEFAGSYGVDEDHSTKERAGKFLDHIYVYAGGVNSFAFCASKPLESVPGGAGRYRNCDPLLATALVRQRAVGGDVARFLTWPYEHLFNRIGAGGLLLETDPYGNFLISGHDYGRARDWGRLGLLYLQRGAWGGDQILSEEFVDFVQTPARDAWAHNPYYGGFFYTNATNLLPTFPSDAYFMSGGGRQRVTIVPSLDLVTVRLGHMAGQIFGLQDTLVEVNKLIAEAMPAT